MTFTIATDTGKILSEEPTRHDRAEPHIWPTFRRDGGIRVGREELAHDPLFGEVKSVKHTVDQRRIVANTDNRWLLLFER